MSGEPVAVPGTAHRAAGSTQVRIVGLVVPSDRIQAWHRDVVRAVEATGATVLITSSRPEARAATDIGLAARALLRAYAWVDAAMFGGPDDPTRPIVRGDIATERDRADARSTAPEPDLVIRLDDQDGAPGRWPAPRLGVWTLRHGERLSTAARATRSHLPPGGAEMLMRRSTTVSRLVGTGEAAGSIAAEVVSRVDPLSIRRGSRGHLRKLPGLVARSVTSIGAADPLRSQPPSRPNDESDDGAGFGAVFIGIAIARLWSGYLVRRIKRKMTRERWIVAISRGSDDPRAQAGSRFRFLDAPDEVEWADPFPVRTPTGDLLFVEEYVPSVGRGRLAVVHLDDSRRGWRSVDTILERATHLSYPFVFRWEGAWYLMPEQAATGSLDLYIAESFPLRWRWHSQVLSLPASDATIARIDGRWWMFAAMAVGGGLAADDLHLFHAVSPLGPWTAHEGNPVSSDVRTARPAGRPYERDGTWYRVAQDGAISYGHSIAIIRIDRLDLEGYAETVVDVIHPDWAPGIVATHTINQDDGLTAVDALSETRRSRRPSSIPDGAPDPAS